MPTLFHQRLLAIATCASISAAAAPTPEGIEFFESKIRPLLVENCYKCHSVDAKKLKGGLLLDSQWGWEQGGESARSSSPENRMKACS